MTSKFKKFLSLVKKQREDEIHDDQGELDPGHWGGGCDQGGEAGGRGAHAEADLLALQRRGSEWLAVALEQEKENFKERISN